MYVAWFRLANSAKSEGIEGLTSLPGGGIPLGEGITVAFPTAKELLLRAQIELSPNVKAGQRIYRSRAARDDHGMRTAGSRWMLAQAPGGNDVVFSVPLSKGADK